MCSVPSPALTGAVAGTIDELRNGGGFGAPGRRAGADAAHAQQHLLAIGGEFEETNIIGQLVELARFHIALGKRGAAAAPPRPPPPVRSRM